MTRSELVRRFVLDSIFENYESEGQIIFDDVAEKAAQCGLTIDRAEIVDALAGLVQDRLAKIQGIPASDAAEDPSKAHFLITGDGVDLCLSDGTWDPLDDDGNLRPEWRLDDA